LSDDETTMPITHLTRSAAAILLCLAIAPAASAQSKAGVMGDLIGDVTEVEGKVLGLAKALPDTAFEWRPGTGVRSSKEVLIHLTGDNYFLPAMIGTAAPAPTGITGSDYKTVEAFEKRPRTRAQVLAELEQSFAFLKQSMTATTDAGLETPAKFAPKSPTRQVWISTVTHLHEHLGQLIAYARSNKVTPPWSK
jgi:uncharacterized damage-inducible protein DinB